MAFIFSLLSFFYMSILSWLYTSNKINRYAFVFFICCLSSVFSAYLSHDSIAYQYIYDSYSMTPFSHMFGEMIGQEVFVLAASKTLQIFPVFFFFCLYAFLSFSVKLALIERVSRNPILSLLCFFAFFFLYLDGTVIRVSLGIAVAYWGIYLLSKNNLLGFLVVILLSSLLFHYSLIVLFIMPFFRSHLSIIFVLLMTLFFLTLYFLGFGIIDLLLTVTGYMDSSYAGVYKLVHYLNRSQMSHPYSMVFIALFFASLLAYYLFKKELSSFELIAFNMLFLSFFFLVALYQSQVFQNRISEIFRYSLVFVAPFFYYALKNVLMRPRWAMVVYCFFLSGYFFYYYYFKGIISDKNLSFLHTYFF
tara:strand:- start:317 stop:1402 length:1086 start_codon:yes stop_codon:yes gene_type:complete